jgi:hypothetical protein
MPFIQNPDLDIADQIVRGGVSVSQLVELSDSGDGRTVSVESRNDGYFKDSLYQSNGSAPLMNPKYERFLEMFVDTGRMEVAYRACVSGNCSKESATQQASRLLKRGEVAARLRFMMSSRKREEAAPASESTRMSRDVKLVELEKIIRTGTPSDKVRAIQEHNRLMAAGRAGAANVPDPCYLADYMRRAAQEGKEPVALARELRGVDEDAPEDIPVPGDDENETPENDADVA